MDGGRTLPKGTTITGITPEGKKRQVGLPNALKTLPTLTASSWKGPGTVKHKGCLNLRKALSELLNSADFPILTQKQLQSQEHTQKQSTGHRLTPAFAEWWMGWPIGWTALKPVETGKSLCRRQ
jgi:hypothetical protein